MDGEPLITERIIPKGSKIDVGWEFNTMVEEGNTKWVRCVFCKHTSKGGITRAKEHQIGKVGDVTKCLRTPEHVKEKLRAAMAKKQNQSSSYREEDEDDLLEIEEINPSIKSKGKRAISSASSSQSSKRQTSMKSFLEEPPEVAIKRKRTTMNEVEKENRDRVLDYIAMFMYDNAIAFNVVKSKSFKLMIEAIGQYGPGLKPPSYHEVRVPLLKRAVDKTKDQVSHLVEERGMYGCSIMSDGWSDRKNRGLINFLVNTPSGSMFVKSVDASSYSKTGERIFSLLDDFVVEMGEENVVQCVTNNGANYKLAGSLLEAKRKRLFLTPCAAHCIDLMLEDIGKLSKPKNAIKRGIALVSFIYNHASSLNMMRTCTNGDLVKFGVTRFATSFLTLQRLNNVKNSLRHMFTSEEWKSTKDAKDRKGKVVEKIVLMNSFWSDVVFTLKAMGPLVRVLKLVDNEKKPAMGYIYEAMSKARQLIMDNFDGDENKYEDVLQIVDARWECQLHHPLHATGYMLNPGIYYREKSTIDVSVDITGGFHACLERLCDEETVGKIYGQLTMFKMARGSFGGVGALRERSNLSPAVWWGNFGQSAPDLMQFAIRVLSLTCSSSGCERNWSTFEHIHSKKRNRLEHQKLQELVFIKHNRSLLERFSSTDLINPILLDEFLDDDEWVMDDEVVEEFWQTVGDAAGAEEPLTTVRTRHETTSTNTSSSRSTCARGKGKDVVIDNEDEDHYIIGDEDDEEEEIPEEFFDED